MYVGILKVKPRGLRQSGSSLHLGRSKKSQTVVKLYFYETFLLPNVREGEGKANFVQSQLEFNLAHFPFPPHIRRATFYAISLSQSLSSVPVPLSLRSPFSLPTPQIITPTFYAIFLSLSLFLSASLPHPI